jgi:hypothetical protein
MITAACEEAVDYEEMAKLATEAFGSRDIVFYPEQFQWFYERCFSLGTTVVTLRDGHRKVGQCAMVRQPVLMHGLSEPAVQLVDLFIMKEFRSKACLHQLYGESRASMHWAEIAFRARHAERKSAAGQRVLVQNAPFSLAPLAHGACRSFSIVDIDLLRPSPTNDDRRSNGALRPLPNLIAR